MLVIGRRETQGVLIRHRDGTILGRICIVRTPGLNANEQVRLGLDFPADIELLRDELMPAAPDPAD